MMRMINKWIGLLIVLILFSISNGLPKEADEVTILSKAIFDSQNKTEAYIYFQKLCDLYFATHKYNDCLKLLNSIGAKKKNFSSLVNYFSALSRYLQLKHLEETQNWDEYFSSGNALRKDFLDFAQSAINQSTLEEPVYVYARLLVWRFHHDQQDAFYESSLDELMQAVRAYAQEKGKGNPQVIKDVADRLLAENLKGKSKELYKLYLNKILDSTTKEEELWDLANSFYVQKNLDLAEEVFDIYMAKIGVSWPKEKAATQLLEIAKKFSYESKENFDPEYAEKIFVNLENLVGPDFFQEDVLYLRGYNLEKAKEFKAAASIYQQILDRFPKTLLFDELKFKIALIYTYINADLEKGKAIFNELAEKTSLSPQIVSSIYQLGILSQWQGELDKARGYFQLVLEKAKEQFEETYILAQKRLKEISEARPMDYNLKMFLDACLKKEEVSTGFKAAQISSSSYRTEKNTPVQITADVFMGESGCMPVEAQYLWSGHLGVSLPSSFEKSFSTQFLHSGTKEINLLILHAQGTFIPVLDIVDVR